ncbi:hypothetical protein Droror1_Dr00024176 [Drosera rotundifolia]
MPDIESERNWWEVQLMAMKDPNNNLNFLLVEILKKHGSITVRNYGSMLDYFFQDIQLQSGSDYKINISDVNVLKFITLNCCSGSLLVSSLSLHVCLIQLLQHLECFATFGVEFEFMHTL